MLINFKLSITVIDSSNFIGLFQCEVKRQSSKKYTNVKNRMRIKPNVKSSWYESFWEMQNVNYSTKDINKSH